MVMANLFEIDPDTKEPLDTFAVASELEALRGKYEDDKTGCTSSGSRRRWAMSAPGR